MAAQTRVRTVILHPHELTAAGLTHVLTQSRSPHFHVVSPEHPDPQPDIVLYNAEHDLDGFHDPRWRALLRPTHSTIIATFQHERWRDGGSALGCGAHGAVSMRLPAEDLIKQVTKIHHARSHDEEQTPPEDACHPEVLRTGLTARELEVLGLIGAGLTNQEIADQLYLSVNTVKTYIRLAYRRIGTPRRSQAVAWVLRHGITTPVRSVAPEHHDVIAG